jgi:hypothetical protein
MATTAELAAELKLLREYSYVRTTRGHDYGCGQRHAELSRRQRRLEELTARELKSAYALERDVTPDELRAAFARIAAPRIARINREDYRRSTPATRRTLEAWRLVDRWVNA